MAKQSSRNQPNQPRSRKQDVRDAKRERARLEAEKQAQQRKQLMIVGGIGALALVVVIALILLNGDDSDSAAPPVVAAPAPLDVPAQGLTLGSPDAPVTVVEYGDYQCPPCGDFARNGFHPLIDEFVATGQVQFQYIPMSFLGDESILAAEAALCANTQGQFWPMHESIFNNQFGRNQGGFSRSRLEQMASKLDLDMDAFRSCMDNGDQRGAVANYAATATQNGVSSTPTFIINNGEPEGWSNYATLRDLINSALGG